MLKLSLFAAAATLFLGLAACSGGSDGTGSSAPGTGDDSTKAQGDDSNGGPAGPAQSQELPWEVISEQGETLLPDVFYADSVQNEQVMPTAIDGHDQIDRLIYPTLGNPNLYVKSDANDSFVSVLRIEPDALAHLTPDMSAEVPGTQLHTVVLHGDALNGLNFYLVSRAGRTAATEAANAMKTPDGKTVFQVQPTELRVNPMPADMPAALKSRLTVRAIFRQKEMAAIPPGLYDLRFEVTKAGKLVTGSSDSQPVYEFQYNALRVFDAPPANDEYSAVNVTDTQVSVGDLYDAKTTAKLTEFVNYINQTSEPGVRKAAFITFNGDLHNGGSPGGVRERFVAMNYNNEAKVILGALKQLTLPIFLTIGNHDGYTSTGIVPQAIVDVDKLVFDSMEKVVGDFGPHPWPNFSFSQYDAYRNAVKSVPGGFHRDIYAGRFVRKAGVNTFGQGWKELPIAQRNEMLYDGFNQWRRTYGPLYSSFRWGKNVYLNTNSYDLRQHRRSGWGMYTVNYGGGLSTVQAEWIKREVSRATTDGEDVILLAHHDPRGGHHGKDFPYYFSQLEFHGIGQSAINYILSEVVDPKLCKLPTWALSDSQQLTCMHDGLQEWMRPDPEFDCDDTEKNSDGTCNAALFDVSKLGAQAHHYRYSGLELIDLIANSPVVRTMILGHTHYNSYEVTAPGEDVVPGNVALDGDQTKLLDSLEVQNPLRGASWLDKALGHDTPDYDPTALGQQGITQANAVFYQDLAYVAGKTQRKLQGQGRELVILRLTSNADLTSQQYAGTTMMGFSVLFLTHQTTDGRGYDLPQVNRVTYFINQGSDAFSQVRTIALQRTTHFGAHDQANPVAQLFNWFN